MEGDLSLLSIPDLLQMICLGGYSRDIHLFDGQTQVGVIAIRNGRVDRCFGYGTWGEAAFFKLVNMRRGRYKVNDAQDMSASDATLTAYSWQELLMEAARQQDEAARAAQTAAASSGRVIPFPTPHSTGSTSSSLEGGAMMRDTSTSGVSELQFDFSPVFDGPSSSNSSGSGLFSVGAPGPSAPPSLTPTSSPPPTSSLTSLPRPATDTGKQEPVGRRPAADTGKQEPVGRRPATDTGKQEPVGRRPATDTGRQEPVGRRPATDTGRQEPVGRRPATDTGRHTLPVPIVPTEPASSSAVTSLITAASSTSGPVQAPPATPVAAPAAAPAEAAPPPTASAPVTPPAAAPAAPVPAAAASVSPSPLPAAASAVPEPILAVASGPIVLGALSSSSDSTADDVMNLLQEATACYLRRDLARAEALLQKCLELRPGDKRALQNLDRIRRKKPQ